jgi:SNF2 family DNA or RNA helicase
VERHQALIDGSAKLGFLKAMLPKLRAKGHRVLLFSQVSAVRLHRYKAT